MVQALERLPARGLMALVRAYRYWLKPWLGNACRFEPSCSAYALQALQAHGACAGSGLAAARLLRCHPWCAGGLDPVPATLSNPGAGIFSRLPIHSKPGPKPRPPRKNS